MRRTSDLCIAVVGMNGVGKSSFGKSLASQLGMKRIDTDTEFRKLHGKEQEYIDVHGWSSFRKAEENIVDKSLLPNHVVVLGGGAVESLAIRSSLKEKAIVIWIQAGKKRVHRQLKEANVTRPEFSKGITKATVQHLLDRRTPLYQEIAAVVLSPHLRFNQRVPTAVGLLKKFVPGERNSDSSPQHEERSE